MTLGRIYINRPLCFWPRLPVSKSQLQESSYFKQIVKDTRFKLSIFCNCSQKPDEMDIILRDALLSCFEDSWKDSNSSTFFGARLEPILRQMIDSVIESQESDAKIKIWNQEFYSLFNSYVYNPLNLDLPELPAFPEKIWQDFFLSLISGRRSSKIVYYREPPFLLEALILARRSGLKTILYLPEKFTESELDNKIVSPFIRNLFWPRSQIFFQQTSLQDVLNWLETPVRWQDSESGEKIIPVVNKRRAFINFFQNRDFLPFSKSVELFFELFFECTRQKDNNLSFVFIPFSVNYNIYFYPFFRHFALREGHILYGAIGQEIEYARSQFNIVRNKDELIFALGFFPSLVLGKEKDLNNLTHELNFPTQKNLFRFFPVSFD